MKIKKELIKREIAGDVILVPVGKSVVDHNGLFILNELAAFLWDRIPEAEGEADLTTAVLAEYEVTPETAAADVHEFVEQLRTMEIL